jgi:hypothetical protein
VQIRSAIADRVELARAEASTSHDWSVSFAEGWERRGGAADVSLLTVIRLPVRTGLVVESGAVIGRRAQVAGTQRQRGQLLWMAECGKVTAGDDGGRRRGRPVA